jgi:type IV secretion system protein TrbL
MRKKITAVFLFILTGAVPAFSFSLSSIAQGKFKIMDAPLIEGIGYFQSAMFSFYQIARIFGTVLAIVCILWNAFRLWFGTESVKKACVDIMSKFLIFIFLFNSYPLIVDGCIDLAINIGMRAGGGLKTVNSKFLALRADYEKKASMAQQQLEQILSKSGDVRLSQSLVNDLVKMTYPDDTDAETLQARYGFEIVDDNTLNMERVVYGERGPAAQRIEEYAKARKPIVNSLKKFYQNAAKSNAVDLLKDKGLADAVVTLRAMNEVFYPNEDYDPADENPVSKYLFNPFMLDENDKPTNLLSPAAMIKVGILISDVITRRGNLNYDDESKTVVEKKLNFTEVATHALQQFIFSVILSLGLILATIFCCIQYVMCIFEYFVVTSVGVIFIPFCLWDGTKSFAAKLVTLFSSFFIKIMVMILCVFWVYGMFLDMGMAIMASDNPLSLVNLGHFIFSCLLAWVVTQNGPQIAVTILNGSPQLSMGEFLHAAGTAVAGAVAARNAVKAGTGLTQAGHKAMQGGVQGLQTTAAAWKGAGQAIDAHDPNLTQGQRFARQVAATGKMALHGLKNNAAAFFTGQETKGTGKGEFVGVGKGHDINNSTKSGAQSYGNTVESAKEFTAGKYVNKAASTPPQGDGASKTPSQPTLDDSARNAKKNFSKPTGKGSGKRRGDA